jgi:hypothetical protein
MSSYESGHRSIAKSNRFCWRQRQKGVNEYATYKALGDERSRGSENLKR